MRARAGGSQCAARQVARERTERSISRARSAEAMAGLRRPSLTHRTRERPWLRSATLSTENLCSIWFMLRPRTSEKASRFTESVIREMTRLAQQHGAVNLVAGLPRLPGARGAQGGGVRGDSRGHQPVRHHLGRASRCATRSRRDFARRYGVPVDPDAQVTVCCGSTEAMMATMLAHRRSRATRSSSSSRSTRTTGRTPILSGATPRFVRLREPRDWTLRPRRARGGVQRTDPRDHHQHAEQPDRQGLHARGAGARSPRCAGSGTCSRSPTRSTSTSSTTAPCTCRWRRSTGMAERTVTINGLSKTFSVTGWRVGWTIAPPDTHGRHPQGARLPHRRRGRRRCRRPAAAALGLPETYYRELASRYQAAPRSRCWGSSSARASSCYVPRGAYYIMTDISGFGFPDDVAFARHLVERGRRGRGARQQLLPRPARRPHVAAVLLLQEGRDAGGGGRAPWKAREQGRRQKAEGRRKLELKSRKWSPA